MPTHPLAVLSRVTVLLLLTATAASRGEVKKVSWGPGSPPHWQEATIASTNRIVAEVVVPPGHDFITAVVDDETGARVRNLLGQVAVSSLETSTASVERTVNVVWDGLNDAGEVVPAGTYHVRGVTIPRPRILFDYAFYNPNPLPWQGYSHSSWGADHTGPGDIACAPANATARTAVVIACAVAENPHAIFGLDDKRGKIWGYKREAGINGISTVAYADGILWLGFKDSIVKIAPDTQSDIGWKRPAGRSSGLTMPGEVKRIAVGAERGAALVAKAGGGNHGPGAAADTLVFFDKESGTARGRRTLPAEVALPWKAYDLVYLNDGRLVVSGDAGVFLATTNGLAAPLSLPGCEAPRQLATDTAGNLYVFDAGADWQVKVYGPDLALVRTIGRRGGQKVFSHVLFTEVLPNSPAGLGVDYDAFRTVGGMDVDRHGNLWVTEPLHPRLVTVWDANEARVDTLVGNTEYGAAGCSLHEQDPAQAYGYGLIFSIAADRIVPHNPARFVASVVTNEPAALRLPRLPQGHYFKSGRLFRSNASGQMREYFIHNDFGYPVLYVSRNGDYRPCAAAVKVAGSGAAPQFAKPTSTLSADWFGVWSDHNQDELVQPEEVFPLPEPGGRIEDFYGMGYVFNPHLTWYLGAFAVAPTRFLDDGTPVFDASGMRKINDKHLALRTGDYLVGDTSGPFQIGQYRFADLDGNVLATYPLNAMGVHASMHAPAPAPGETRGELCYAGTATVSGDLGPIVATQGNMGQMFVFTGDGLFVCALFKDVRHGPSPWPPAAQKGTDFTNCSMVQEPFVGCLVIQDDGKMRVIFGRTEVNVCVVAGLEQAKRFGPIPVQFGATNPVTNVQKTAGVDPLVVPRLPADGAGAITVDGSLDDWRDAPVRTIQAGDNVLARMRVAHTGTRLLLGIAVQDDTPLVNGFADWRSAFRTGDSIDVSMGPAGERSTTPVAGDVRVMLVPVDGGAAVVLYRPVVPGTEPDKRVPFTSPIGTTYVDEVTLVEQCDVVFKKTADGYVCEASLPLSLFGVSPQAGLTVAGDIGVLSSDGGGQQTVARNYLFNRTWTMTADLGAEAMLKPNTWGVIVFE